MKKSVFIIASITIGLTALVGCSDDPDETACWEFHHSIRYRSPDSEWTNYYDTICNITETRAEEIRVLNDQNDSQWIHNCAKRKITTSHKHVTNSFYQ